MLTKDDINRLTARIEKRVDSAQYPIGSGVLWAPFEGGKYIYVFTARHVVAKAVSSNNALVVRFLGSERQEVTLEVDVSNIAMHSNETVDAAILRCNFTAEAAHFYAVEDKSNYLNGAQVITYGFPEGLYDPDSFVLSMQHMTGKLQNYDNAVKKIRYKIDSDTGLNNADRNAELVGYSGGGIYAITQEHYRLIGIHSKAPGNNAAASVLECIPIERIIEICSEHNWDAPEYLSTVDGYLKDALGVCYGEFNERPDLQRDMITVADTNHANLIQSDFCGYALECEYAEAFHRCESFRENLLLLITILKAVSAKPELAEPVEYDTASGKSLPLYYICSEGMDAKRRVSKRNFVRAIKLDYSNRRRIKDDSLVVWNSKLQTDSELVCTKEEFDNIIQDISHSKYASGEIFDIMKGQAPPKSVTIIHIDELTKQLNGKDLDEFKTWIDNQIG